MATSIPLHPIAAEALKTLKDQLELEGQDASERKIVNALVYCATPAQTLGMLRAFVRDAKRADLAAEAAAQPEEGDG